MLSRTWHRVHRPAQFSTTSERLSTLSFSIDQDKTKSTGKEVLVLAPRMNEPVEANTYITAIGEAVKFGPPSLLPHGVLLWSSENGSESVRRISDVFDVTSLSSESSDRVNRYSSGLSLWAVA